MIDASRGESVQRYADVNSLILDTQGEKCLDISYNSLVSSLNETSWNSKSAEGSKCSSDCMSWIFLE